VDAVLAGDRDAFRRLVERESTSVVRTCYRILGDLHEAEDAGQEAFVTAFRSLATWRGDGPFGAWLARIAVRIALRQAGRRRPVAWLDPAEPERAAGDRSSGSGAAERNRGSLAGPALAASGTHDPAQIALRGERAAELRRAVAALDEPYREVVALRFFGELSLAEIALESGRPLGTVKTHLHRGLSRLRSNLEAEDSPR
jgi:RNA polymerase sigma-70 factor, ECF subfamily